ncbi:MAG: carboxypeptidase regulatory-like domain-containing protein, partial [Mucilaginibacter polytrichastri]|nr:carboxypeptidase regulatory-like domain-containing protein [Mucilaginibacter polytrichastri]
MKKLALLLFVLLTAATAFGQITSSTISGKVIDEKGEALIGVSVQAINTETGTRYGVQTNADGRYTIANANPGGPYTITLTYVGYTKEQRDGINLTLGSTTFNFIMRGEATALKEVVVKSNRFGTKTGAGTNINQGQLKTLPTISRSLQDFTRVTPQSNNNSFLGTNFRYNNVTLDGA